MRLAAAECHGAEHRGAGGVFGIAHGFVADELNLRRARHGTKRLRALVAHAVRPHGTIAHQRFNRQIQGRCRAHRGAKRRVRHRLQVGRRGRVEQKTQPPVALLRQRRAQHLRAIPDSGIEPRAEARAGVRPVAKRCRQQIVKPARLRRQRRLALLENELQARLLLEGVDQPHGRGRVLCLDCTPQLVGVGARLRCERGRRPGSQPCAPGRRVRG